MTEDGCGAGDGEGGAEDWLLKEGPASAVKEGERVGD